MAKTPTAFFMVLSVAIVAFVGVATLFSSGFDTDFTGQAIAVQTELQASENTIYGGAFQAEGCTDTDDGDLYEKGSLYIDGKLSYTDECIDEGTLHEYYCGETGYSIYPTCRYGCYDGRCLEEGEIDYCVDSDGDLSSSERVQERGTVTVQEYGGESETEYEDYCVSDSVVMEYACDGVDIGGGRISCSTYYLGVCVDGRCLPECSDSDNGDDNQKYVLGEASGYNDDEGAEIEHTDVCVGNTKVREAFCKEDGTLGVKNLNCDGKCVDGRCLYADLEIVDYEFGIDRTEEEIVLTYTVKNSGGEDVDDFVTLSIMITSYGILTADGENVVIPVGEEVEVEYRADIEHTDMESDARGSGAEMDIYVVVNYDEDIMEEDYSNNDHYIEDIVLTSEDFI